MERTSLSTRSHAGGLTIVRTSSRSCSIWSPTWRTFPPWAISDPFASSAGTRCRRRRSKEAPSGLLSAPHPGASGAPLQPFLGCVQHGRRVHFFKHPAAAEIHMDAAGQTRIEAAHGAHDVDAFELLPGRVFLEDRGVLHRVLVRPGRAVDVARVRVPRRRRIRVVVRDLAVADYHVVREYAAHRLGEAAA